MPIKTKEGWKSRKQIKNQEKAWKAARSALMTKLGPAVDDPALLESKAAEIFKEFDSDANGGIDAAEIKSCFGKVGVILSDKEVKAMIEEADEDGDGLIDAVEFKNLLTEEVARYKRVTTALCVVS